MSSECYKNPYIHFLNTHFYWHISVGSKKVLKFNTQNYFKRFISSVRTTILGAESHRHGRKSESREYWGGAWLFDLSLSAFHAVVYEYPEAPYLCHDPILLQFWIYIAICCDIYFNSYLFFNCKSHSQRKSSSCTLSPLLTSLENKLEPPNGL